MIMNTKKITFKNADMAWDMSALILLPEGFDESKRYPTMISVHPFGSCKEQTSSAVYGKALAELGYVVIAFDASFQGNLVDFLAMLKTQANVLKISVVLSIMQ